MMKLDMEISKNVENGNFKNRDLDMLDLKQFQDVVNSRILRILILRKIFGFCFFRTQMKSFNKSAEKIENCGIFKIQELTTSRISMRIWSVASDFPNLVIFKTVSNYIAANQANFCPECYFCLSRSSQIQEIWKSRIHYIRWFFVW